MYSTRGVFMEIAGGPEPQNSPDGRHNQMAEAFRNFQQCVHHCQKAVFFTDAAGVLQRVNPAFERLTGYSAAESVGKDLSWITAGGPTGKAYRQLWKDIFENQSFHGTLDVRKKDGTCLPLRLLAIPVHDRKGGISSLVCVGQDVANEHELQFELAEVRRNLATHTADRALAHDLNNALMTISAYAELSLDGLTSEHPLWRNLQEIRSASKRASELGGEMLSRSRPASEDRLPRPRNPEGLRTEPAASDQLPAQPLETIMIVEDELVIRTAVCEFLSGEGYEVLSAINGCEAMGKIEAHAGPIRLVITDINMPRMSGPELAQALASSHPETRVLFVSGYGEDAAVVKGAAGPGRNFLLKPFPMRTLAEKVRRILADLPRARAADASGR